MKKKKKEEKRKAIFNIHHIYPGISKEQLHEIANQCSSGDEIRIHGEHEPGAIFFKHLPGGLTITGDCHIKR